MPTMIIGGPILVWEPLESQPEPESPDGTPYWKSPASGYPGAIVEPPTDPEPVPETPTEPDPEPETPIESEPGETSDPTGEE